MNTASLRQRHLKDLHSNWRAVLLSYDEGLVKGDAMLAAAIWRNLFNGRQDVDFAKVAMVVAYLRRELRRVTMADAQEVLGGEWKFEGHPAAEADEVRKPANEFLKALQEMQKEGGKSAGKKVKKAAKEA